MHGAQAQSLAQELGSHLHKATESATESQLRSMRLESVLRNKRSHHNEKPVYPKKESAHSNKEPLVPQWRHSAAKNK